MTTTIDLITTLRQHADVAEAGGKLHWATAIRRAVDALTAAEAERDVARAECERLREDAGRQVAIANDLRAALAARDERVLELSVCLCNLVFMAETSGGTAGRDEALCTAITAARALLTPPGPEAT